MAPDSKLCRHLLGEAATGLQRSVLKATVPVCLFLSLSAPNLEARTEPGLDSWSQISASFLDHERQLYGDPARLASLIPPMSSVNSSPVGRWSNRIQIPIPNHPSVQKYIRFFDGPGRITFEKSLERACSYAPIMAEILESLHVPAEMLAIVLVESNFKGKASHRGAGGYWQMLASTARSMGLKVDRWVDERRDPIKSTQAAARYLHSFHERFGSWPLAIAAYNLGDGPVVGAVKRHGTSDFWELCRRGALPGATRVYVPKVMAAIHIMRDLDSYGFGVSGASSIYDFESIRVQTPLKLDEIAKWVGVPVDSMRELNPSLRSDRVPPDSDFALRLPSGARDRFDLAYEGYLRR